MQETLTFRSTSGSYLSPRDLNVNRNQPNDKRTERIRRPPEYRQPAAGQRVKCGENEPKQRRFAKSFRRAFVDDPFGLFAECPHAPRLPRKTRDRANLYLLWNR